MHTVEVTTLTTHTIEVADMHDLTIGLTDSGPGGEPPNRGVITVNGEQLCYADELTPAAFAAFGTLRAELYAKYLTKLGVTP